MSGPAHYPHESEVTPIQQSAMSPHNATSSTLNPVELVVTDLTSPHSNPIVPLLPQELQNDLLSTSPVAQPKDPHPTPDDVASASSSDNQIAHNTAADKYLQLMDRLRTHWKDRPDVLIQFRDIHYSVRVPIVDVTTRSFLQAGANGIVNLIKRLDPTGYLRQHDRSVELHALATCSGRIAPGTMTLLLAPPGHGKSTLLRALAGRLFGDAHFGGEVLYNGQTAQQLTRKGVRMQKLLSYVGQTDIHFPVLTVKETLAFAADNANASVAEFNDPQLDQMEAERPDRLIHMIGLEEAANTVIGNDLLRGISGGQKKRVTIGELLITNARVHLLDEVSTGLDSAITFHIFNALRSICLHQGTAVVTSLLQPTPETYGLFDEIILLREGEIVFHGKREHLRPFFRDVLRFPIPEDEDEAGFAVDYLTNPTILQGVQQRKQRRRTQQANEHETSHPSHSDVRDDEKQAAAAYSTAGGQGMKGAQDAPALDTSVIVDRWRHSTDFADLAAASSVALKVNQGDPKNALEPTQWLPFTQRQFAQDQPHSAWHHFKLSLSRQKKLTGRNRQVFMPRFFQAVLVGIIFGTLFYQLDPADYNSRFGVTLYVCMYTAFSNLSELPVASEARAVVTKQLDSSFFPSLPYVFSVIIIALPIIFIEIVIFSLWMYWMTGFAAEAGRFFFFMFALFSSSLALSTFFRSISYVTPNPDVARQLDLPFIIIFVIFGGFLIPYNEVPNWLIWVFWISPLSWTFRSIALNEFKAAQFDTPTTTGERTGDFDMNQFDVSTNDQYKWAGIGYLLGFFLLFAVISSYAIKYIRAGVSLGTKRVASVQADAVRQPGVTSRQVPNEVELVATPPETVNGNGAARQSEMQGTQVTVPIGKQMGNTQMSKSFQMVGLPFIPVSLAWRDINYFVTIVTGKGKTKTKVEKQLLKGINGFSQPGTTDRTDGFLRCGQDHADGRHCRP